MMDLAGPTPHTVSLNYKTFQGAHVSDLPTTFCPPRRSVGSSRDELSIPDDGLHLSWDLVLRIMQLLSNESRALPMSVVDLQGAISALIGRHMVMDSLLHALCALLASFKTSTNL
ncbi:hypothetical protein E5676_scaffold369G00200 [Cucumis melo var. makuwa]|uniref:Flocculation protein FLO11-like n=1 Tax=Cucumis melo var. makuwa TaxID=1194695 RepID=A0A5D3BG21_CUCMM|nr:hypothetical protein E5676_scaffold369G00200 [Cucumis melo var. makuwa]